MHVLLETEAAGNLFWFGAFLWNTILHCTFSLLLLPDLLTLLAGGWVNWVWTGAATMRVAAFTGIHNSRWAWVCSIGAVALRQDDARHLFGREATPTLVHLEREEAGRVFWWFVVVAGEDALVHIHLAHLVQHPLAFGALWAFIVTLGLPFSRQSFEYRLALEGFAAALVLRGNRLLALFVTIGFYSRLANGLQFAFEVDAATFVLDHFPSLALGTLEAEVRRRRHHIFARRLFDLHRPALLDDFFLALVARRAVLVLAALPKVLLLLASEGDAATGVGRRLDFFALRATRLHRFRTGLSLASLFGDCVAFVVDGLCHALLTRLASFAALVDGL